VGEFNYEWTKGSDATEGTEKNTRITPAVGFMLFF
jgi:hypothetical protein